MPESAPPESAPDATARLLTIMARLRAPEDGCPWDQQQDFASIAPYTIEEAYEVADAIARQDKQALREELGDLLFQVVYHARLAEERGWFDFAAVAATIADKMVTRHPHVFAAAAARTATSQTTEWEAQKQAERAASAQHGTLANIPQTLPALTRAVKLTARAARIGFDWSTPAQVLDKLSEETIELQAELNQPDQARIADEYGDMLFVLANLGRKLNLDPEASLRQANAKFTRRFEAIEALLAAQGRLPAEAALPELESLWQQVKRQERDLPHPITEANR